MSVRGAFAALATLLLLAGCGEGDKSGQAGRQGGAPVAEPADKPVPNPLRFATEGAYPPYNLVDPSGALTGFDIEVANEVCARMKIECRIVAQNWDGIIPGLQTGKYDAIIAGMSITTERLQVVDFSQGYAITPAYFVALNDSPLQTVEAGLERVGLDEVDAAEQVAIDAIKAALKGKTVGVQGSTIHANFADTFLAGVAQVRRYETQETLALDLASGRIDAGLADSTAWEAFLDSPEGQNASFFGPGFDQGVFGKGLGIAIRKGEPRLLEAIDAALTGMKQDGTLSRMAERWFGFDASMK